MNPEDREVYNKVMYWYINSSLYIDDILSPEDASIETLYQLYAEAQEWY